MLCWRYLQYIFGPYMQGSTTSYINNFRNFIFKLLIFNKLHIFIAFNKY